jgi:undecaprenyl-diphosphatase
VSPPFPGEQAILWLVALSACFAGLSILVHAPPLARLDRRITRWIQRGHGPRLDRLGRAATLLGNTEVLIATGAAAAAGFVLTARPWAALLSAAALLGMPIAGGIKRLVRRPRPASEIARIVLPVVGLSFPSGHAMSTLMFYGFVAHVIALHHPGPGGRLAAGTLAALVLAVGLSRVYLGAHWFSDVIGGWAGGSCFLLLESILYQSLGAAELGAG